MKMKNFEKYDKNKQKKSLRVRPANMLRNFKCNKDPNSVKSSRDR